MRICFLNTAVPDNYRLYHDGMIREKGMSKHYEYE